MVFAERRGGLGAQVRRRRRGLALAGLVAGVWWAGSVVGASDSRQRAEATTPTTPHVRILIGRRVVADLPAEKATQAALMAQVTRNVPAERTVARGRARIDLRYARSAAVEAAVATAAIGGDTQLDATPFAARVPAPAVKQEQRNTCESAALHILLAATGKAVSQQSLQQALPTSGGPDPVERDGKQVWGDPDVGYVGRPNGGGVAGGFGVFPGPVRATAAKFGVQLENLTGRSPDVVYRRLLAGRAVMTWIGLSEGPYATWTSPEGKAIKVNFGEHTVVLHGIDAAGRIEVSNPLEGTRERWNKGTFEALWRRLGNRALATT